MKYPELTEELLNKYEDIEDFAINHFAKSKCLVRWSNVFGEGGGVVKAETKEHAALIIADLRDPNKGGTSYNIRVSCDVNLSHETKFFGTQMYRF